MRVVVLVVGYEFVAEMVGDEGRCFDESSVDIAPGAFVR